MKGKPELSEREWYKLKDIDFAARRGNNMFPEIGQPHIEELHPSEADKGRAGV